MTTTADSVTATPVAIGTRGGPDKPTLRKDTWWVEPVITVAVLTAFVVYSTWAAFVGKDYYAGVALNRDLISPFYSPCIANSCVPGSHTFGTLPFWNYSPALLILIFPLGFRLTCYYYRKAYYRSFWWSPPACAVADAPRQLQRRDPLPAHPPEHPPLLLLDPPALQLHPDLRRHPRLPPALSRQRRRARPHRHQRRHRGALRQRRVPLALLAVVPRLPALLRRPGEVVRQAPDPPQALEVRHAAQRPPHALRLDQPLRRRPRATSTCGWWPAGPSTTRASTSRSRGRGHGPEWPTTRPTTTTSSSSAPAAPGCAPPSRPRSAACGWRSSASRCSARRTRSWPRAAWPPPWATSGPRTTGRSTSATPCAAARCSTTGAWRRSTPWRRPTGSSSSSAGARCSTAPRTAASPSATSAATATPAWPTWATAPGWS